MSSTQTAPGAHAAPTGAPVVVDLGSGMAPGSAAPSARAGATGVPAGEPIVQIAGAEVHGPRGVVFGPLDAVSATPVTVVVGERGSGRTSLLLALSGRMRLRHGDLSVLGVSSKQDLTGLRRQSAIAGFAGMDDLEGSVDVIDSVRERIAIESAWYAFAPRLTDEDVHARLAPVFGNVPVPHARTVNHSLSERQEHLLRIALALESRPRVLVMDDLDAIKNPVHRRSVAERLAALVAGGLTVIVGSADPGVVELFPAGLATTVHLPSHTEG